MAKWVSAKEACDLLSVSRHWLYELVRDKKLETDKRGGRLAISRRSIDERLALEHEKAQKVQEFRFRLKEAIFKKREKNR